MSALALKAVTLLTLALLMAPLLALLMALLMAPLMAPQLARLRGPRLISPLEEV